MDFKQLRALITVAETGNVSKAAKILNVVQPAVSKQIKQLEDELGVSLFFRDKRGMELTYEGKILEEHAHRIMDEIKVAREKISATSEMAIGTVTVGLLASVSDVLSSILIGSLERLYPRIEVRIVMGHAEHILSWLERGDLEIALLYADAAVAEMEISKIIEENLYLIGAVDCGLSVETPVAFSDAMALPLIFANAKYGIRYLVDQAAKRVGVRPRVVLETSALSVQKRLILEGYGHTILPWVAVADDVKNGRLAAAPIVMPTLTRQLGLGVMSSRLQSKATQCVLAEMLLCIKRIVHTGEWPEARWLGAREAEAIGVTYS
ncbi:LysR family transcriptional regulator [Candidimonas nitroreducens]|uniref:LysR family transcriptional regulator n=1 Tax=Candidimonas nitroreducens TaxID=683354 RepID=A0A225MLX5_9BURK|nr:LysR substrate-binding domain-containing protein [Candidimonas nitroreducens]OWT61972.1 LysR family transcriptional regulator [Candidimonas nitroreducens]